LNAVLLTEPVDEALPHPNSDVRMDLEQRISESGCNDNVCEVATGARSIGRGRELPVEFA